MKANETAQERHERKQAMISTRMEIHTTLHRAGHTLDSKQRIALVNQYKALGTALNRMWLEENGSLVG